MADLKNKKVIYFKGFLFLFGGLLACVGIVLERPTLKVAVLLAAAIWCFSRAYYFAFYVIEHYVDGRYKFAGITSFFKYLFRKS